MNIELKLKQLENLIESNPDLFPSQINFGDMSEDELKERYNEMTTKIKTQFDFNDAEVKKYFEALSKWEEISKTDEIEAGKFWGNYEYGLTIKKWERITGMKWEGNYSQDDY